MNRTESLKIIREHLIKQGFYINDGIKFGTDLLVYTDKPEKVHSKYALLFYDENMTYQHLLAVQRVCLSTNKTLIVTRVIQNNSNVEIEYIQVERFIL